MLRWPGRHHRSHAHPDGTGVRLSFTAPRAHPAFISYHTGPSRRPPSPLQRLPRTRPIVGSFLAGMAAPEAVSRACPAFGMLPAAMAPAGPGLDVFACTGRRRARGRRRHLPEYGCAIWRRAYGFGGSARGAHGGRGAAGQHGTHFRDRLPPLRRTVPGAARGRRVWMKPVQATGDRLPRRRSLTPCKSSRMRVLLRSDVHRGRRVAAAAHAD
jgi:hypothetical protein